MLRQTTNIYKTLINQVVRKLGEFLDYVTCQPQLYPQFHSCQTFQLSPHHLSVPLMHCMLSWFSPRLCYLCSWVYSVQHLWRKHHDFDNILCTCSSFFFPEKLPSFLFTVIPFAVMGWLSLLPSVLSFPLVQYLTVFLNARQTFSRKKPPCPLFLFSCFLLIMWGPKHLRLLSAVSCCVCQFSLYPHFSFDLQVLSFHIWACFMIPLNT